jgi:hypothetical protein
MMRQWVRPAALKEEEEEEEEEEVHVCQKGPTVDVNDQKLREKATRDLHELILF